MMHQIVDLDGYSPLEIGLKRWQLNIEPDGVRTAADAAGEACLECDGSIKSTQHKGEHESQP